MDTSLSLIGFADLKWYTCLSDYDGNGGDGGTPSFVCYYNWYTWPACYGCGGSFYTYITISCYLGTQAVGMTGSIGGRVYAGTLGGPYGVIGISTSLVAV